MRVHRSELVEGCILSSDVFSKSENPIIPKKTALTREHLEVLKAFNINSVNVESVLANGQPYKPGLEHTSDTLTDSEGWELESGDPQYTSKYFKAVKQFENYFKAWQKGESVNFIVIKAMLDPLIHTFIEEPKRALNLYHYSQEDEYLYHHAIYVGLLSAILANKMKYETSQVYDIALSGLLADAGMAKLPPRLLQKPMGLNDAEVKQIRQHPVFSYQMLKAQKEMKADVLLGVLQHHEREDGSGYPLGIKGEQLHPYSKIIALADSFHAMICERPYRPKQPLYKVLEILKKEQFGKFDPQVLNSLYDLAIFHSLGTKVRLTNNEIGEIIFVDKLNPTRPILKMRNEQTLSLMDYPSLFIDDLVQIQA